MKEIITRVSNYSVRLHQEARPTAALDAEGEIITDVAGQPIIHEEQVTYILFSDNDGSDAWAYEADASFRAKMMQILAQGLTDEQRREAAAILNGGIVVPMFNEVPR